LSKGRILIVDDESIVVLGLKRELEFEGYSVETALTAETAMDVMRRDKVDIVYADLMMPSVDGVELCRQIRETSPDTDVVIISGHPEAIADRLEEIKSIAGSERVLEKPFMDDDVIIMTEKIMNERRQK